MPLYYPIKQPSTFAWFQASNKATISASSAPATGTVTSTYTDATAGSFTVTPLFTKPSTEVELTDPATGKSYVFDKSITSANVATEGASHKIEVTPAKPTASLTTCGYKIQYKGTATTLAGVQAEWNDAKDGKNKLTFKLDGDGTNADLIRFGETADTNGVVTGASYSWAKINSVTFGNNILSEDGQTFTLSPASIFVSLTGSDTVIQTASDVYTVNMSVTISA